MNGEIDTVWMDMFIFLLLPWFFIDEFGLIKANAGNRGCYILQGLTGLVGYQQRTWGPLRGEQRRRVIEGYGFPYQRYDSGQGGEPDLKQQDRLFLPAIVE